MGGIRKSITKHGTRWGFGLVITIIACAQVLNFFSINTIERLDIYFYDLRVRAQQPQLDQRIAIIDIDVKSLAEIGRFPWSRHIVADLVTKLTDHYHVKAIGFDVQFSEPDTSSGYNTLASLAKTDFKHIPSFEKKLESLKPALDYDALFAKALKDKPVVLGYSLSEKIKKGALPEPAFNVSDLGGRHLFAKQANGYEANIPLLQNAARSAGFFNEEVDADGRLRSSPLILKLGDGFYESLGLATVKVALGATTIRPEFISDADHDYGVLEALVLNTKPRETRIPVEDLMKVQIDYRGTGGPNGGGFRYVSAADVLHERAPINDLAQRIVLIGTTAPGLNDLRDTPINHVFPGVEAHANIIASILDGHFKQSPDYSTAFNLLQVLLMGGLLLIGLPLLKPLSSILYTLVLVTAVVWFNFWAYREQGLIFPMATALLLIFALFLFNLAWGYWFEFRQGRAMTNLFGEYVAPELVEVMADDPARYSMEGEKRELTILFADVRGFTTISEKLEANELREYINLYLTSVSQDIQKNRGTLDKYIGDCVMAFWGAPVKLPDHASRAVATALSMQRSAQKLDDAFIARGWPSLKIGVGLNTGEVRVGDMGSKVRRAYTVMGDPVNVASRLEGITKEYGVGVVVGELTKNAAPEFTYRELDRVRVKGKNEPIVIFEPIGLTSTLDEATHKELAMWHAALALYRQQQWDESESIIRSLHSANPEFYLYTLTLSNIERYRNNPPTPEWDGVTTYTTK